MAPQKDVVLITGSSGLIGSAQQLGTAWYAERSWSHSRFPGGRWRIPMPAGTATSS